MCVNSLESIKEAEAKAAEERAAHLEEGVVVEVEGGAPVVEVKDEALDMVLDEIEITKQPQMER